MEDTRYKRHKIFPLLESMVYHVHVECTLLMYYRIMVQKRVGGSTFRVLLVYADKA